MTTLTIDVPREYWLTSNGRYHWAVEAQRTRWLKHLGSIAGRGHATFTGPVRCVAWIAYPKGATGRADPNNAAPATKALIDGLVVAGLLVDDDAKHLSGPDHRRDTNTCTANYRVRLVFTEAAA
jgi:crossover junction endodeoxyribonuclease RusA